MVARELQPSRARPGAAPGQPQRTKPRASVLRRRLGGVAGRVGAWQDQVSKASIFCCAAVQSPKLRSTQPASQ
jgi:hypothetical protein